MVTMIFGQKEKDIITLTSLAPISHPPAFHIKTDTFHTKTNTISPPFKRRQQMVLRLEHNLIVFNRN